MSNINLPTATGRITLDSSGVAAGANSAQLVLTSLNQVVRENWWGLKSVGEALGAIGGIAEGGLALATSAAIGWESSLAKVETAIHSNTASNLDNAKSLEVVSNGLLQLGQSTPTPISQLASLAAQVARLGVAAPEVASVTQVIDNLGNTIDVNSKSSVEALGRLTATLGLNNDEVKQAGSVIFELGRQTPATADATLQLSQRMTSLASSAGLSAPQILALASSVAAVAPNARTGGSAILAFFQDIQKAVQGGGQSLETFAAITGTSVDEFKKRFQNDAAGTLVTFLRGLGQVKDAGFNLNQVLDTIGLKSAAQQQIVLALADAQNQNADASAKLSSQLQIANQAVADGNSLQRAAQEQYQTVSAQLKELKNLFSEIGINLGSIFLPPVKFAITLLRDFALGVQSIPAPLRDVVAGAILVVGAISGMGAVLFIVGPRIIQVWAALQQLIRAYISTTPAAIAAAAAIKAEGDAEVAAAAQVAANTLAIKARLAQSEADTLALLARAEAMSKLRLAEATQAQAVLREQAAAAAAQKAATGTALENEAAQIQLAVAQERVELSAIAVARAEQDVALADDRVALAAANAARAQQQAALAAEEAATAEATAAASADVAATAETAANTSRLAGIPILGGLIQRLRGGSSAAEEAAAGAEGLAASGEAAAGSLGGLAGAAAEAAPALGAAGAATEGLGIASTITGVATGGLGFAVGGLILGVGGLITTLIGASKAHKQAAADTAAAAGPNRELVGILQQEGDAADTAAKKWIVNALAMTGSIAEAAKLGYTSQNLIDIIRGTASPDFITTFIGKLEDASARGDKAAKALKTIIQSLFNEYQASADAAGQLAQANKDAGLATDGLTDSTSALTTALDDNKKTKDKAAQAAITLVSALFNEQETAFNVQSAVESLTKAQESLARVQEDQAKASIDVVKAQLDQQKSILELQQRERDLASARQEQQEDVVKAQNAYADAQDRIITTADAVRRAQDALNKLTTTTYQKDLTDATNALADANIRLRDSTKDVSDAQWYLNYLIQEGASNRDIQNARDNLTKAQQKQKDETASLAKDQEALNKIQSGPDKDAMLSAQDALTSALKAQRDAALSLTDAQKSLDKERRDAANDTAYKNALIAEQQAKLSLQQAGYAYTDSLIRQRDASRELAIRTGDVAKAQLGVEKAYYGQAQAAVEVQKQTALAKGEIFGATEESQALDRALLNIGNSLQGPVGQAIRDVQGRLHEALSAGVYPLIDGKTAIKVNPIDTSNVDKAAQALGKADETAHGKHRSIWEAIYDDVIGNAEKITKGIVDHAPGIIGAVANWGGGVLSTIKRHFGDALGVVDLQTGAIAPTIDKHAPRIAGAFDGAMAGGEKSVSQHSSSIVGLVEQLGADMLSTLGGLPTQFFTYGVHIIEGLINGIVHKGGDLITTVFDHIVSPLKKIPGIGLLFGSPSKLYHQFGQWLMEGLQGGIAAHSGLPADALTKVIAEVESAFEHLHLTPEIEALLFGGSAPLAYPAASQQLTALQGNGTAGGSSSTSIGHQGDIFNFHEVQAKADDIFKEAAWQRRIRR